MYVVYLKSTYTYQMSFNSHFAETAKKATRLAFAPILEGLARLGHEPSLRPSHSKLLNYIMSKKFWAMNFQNFL